MYGHKEHFALMSDSVAIAVNPVGAWLAVWSIQCRNQADFYPVATQSQQGLADHGGGTTPRGPRRQHKPPLSRAPQFFKTAPYATRATPFYNYPMAYHLTALVPTPLKSTLGRFLCVYSDSVGRSKEVGVK